MQRVHKGIALSMALACSGLGVRSASAQAPAGEPPTLAERTEAGATEAHAAPRPPEPVHPRSLARGRSLAIALGYGLGAVGMGVFGGIGCGIGALTDEPDEEWNFGCAIGLISGLVVGWSVGSTSGLALGAKLGGPEDANAGMAVLGSFVGLFVAAGATVGVYALTKRSRSAVGATTATGVVTAITLPILGGVLTWSLANRDVGEVRAALVPTSHGALAVLRLQLGAGR